MMGRHPTPEDLGEPTFKVAGLQLWVHGREFPHVTDDWLRVTAHCGASGASVWASGSILQVLDLVRWADQCGALLQGTAAIAELASAEPDVRVALRRSDRLGHYTMRVEITPDLGRQEHAFVFDIDQSYFPELIRQCRAVAVKYPIPGELFGHGV